MTATRDWQWVAGAGAVGACLLGLVLVPGPGTGGVEDRGNAPITVAPPPPLPAAPPPATLPAIETEAAPPGADARGAERDGRGAGGEGGRVVGSGRIRPARLGPPDRAGLPVRRSGR